MKKGFKVVNVEVSGKCNARCKYCPTGSRSHNEGKYIDLILFEKIIKKLIDTGVYQEGKSIVALYNWGEPFLHPNFKGIIEIINKYGVKFGISTNAGKVYENINEEFVKNLSFFGISMSGFSQESYDKGHKLNFEKVKANIQNIANRLRESGFKDRVEILYHIYQFNIHEINSAGEFAESIGGFLSPYYAVLGNREDQIDYLKGVLPYQKLYEATKELCLYDLSKAYSDVVSHSRTCDIQEDYLIVDENGSLVSCCGVQNNSSNYRVGDFILEDIDVLLEKKFSFEFCKYCIENCYHRAGESRQHSYSLDFVNDLSYNFRAGKDLKSALKFKGYFDDGWVEDISEFKVCSGEEGKLTLKGYYPKEITGNENVSVVLNGGGVIIHRLENNLFEFTFDVPKNANTRFQIKTDFSFRADAPDVRTLSFILQDIIGR